MNKLKLTMIFAIFNALMITNTYALIGELIDTAGRTAKGAVNVATDATTGTVDAITLKSVREKNNKKRYYKQAENDQDNQDQNDDYVIQESNSTADNEN